MARRPAGRTVAGVALLLGAVAALPGTPPRPGGPPPAAASDTGLSGAEGHPRERFPLAVHTARLADPGLDAALRRAVSDWSALSQAALGLPAFTWAAREAVAQVVVTVEPHGAQRMMGVTYLNVGTTGVVELPVRIVVFEPAGRGQTTPEVVLYQVAAHELGHALGLVHTGDPRSLMCCIPGSVDFKDAAVRDAYVAARRQPDVGSVRAQLTEHYGRFWARPR